MGRVKAGWLGVSLLVGVVATLSTACGSSDAGGNGSSGSANSFCATLNAKERECGLLGQGTTACVDYKDAAEPCETACVKKLSCPAFVQSVCGDPQGTSSLDLYICYAQCVGLAPVVCDGLTLPGFAHCDGLTDCSDGSDEAGCTDLATFKCRNVNQFIDPVKRCDKNKDCSDGSDETPDCADGLSCKVNGVQTTLSIASTCNNYAECDDGSDEPVSCAVFKCPTQQ